MHLSCPAYVLHASPTRWMMEMLYSNWICLISEALLPDTFGISVLILLSPNILRINVSAVVVMSVWNAKFSER